MQIIVKCFIRYACLEEKKSALGAYPFDGVNKWSSYILDESCLRYRALYDYKQKRLQKEVTVGFVTFESKG